MKRSKSPSRHTQPSLEPLEARIAPAALKNIAPIGEATGSGTHLVEYHEGPGNDASALGFVNLETVTNDPIADAVGHLPGTYYMKLTAGQSITVFSPNQSAIPNYVKVDSGVVIAFFHDINGDDKFQTGELEGFSISDGTTLSFKSTLQGDIVENLSKDGKTLDPTGLSTGSGVKNLTFLSGDVSGKLLVGSDLKKASFKGIDGIYGGTAAGGQTYDFFPDIAGVTGTIAPIVPNPGVKGVSITNVTVDSIGAVQATPIIINHPVGTIQAGDGGFGAAGGVLSNIQVLQDGNGFSLMAGNGGNANTGAHKLNGGAGGAVSAIYIAGVNDLDTPGHPTQNSPILIQAGKGGLGDTGIGGKGGAASNVWVGFRKLGPGAPQPSANFLHDNVTLIAGDAGDGQTGGAGGAVSVVRFNVNTTGDAVLANSEILVQAGHGGSVTGAKVVKAGVGGAIKDVLINNLVQQDLVDPSGPVGQLTFLPNATITLNAGDAGVATDAKGAVGGAVSTVKILGSNIFVNAGDGSSGNTAGAGGSVTGVTFLQDGNIFTRTGAVNAGVGGDAAKGSGAPGGNVTNFKLEDSDLGLTGATPGTVFSINAGNAGNGGDGANGVGGKGGSVTGLQLFDRDSREGQAPSTRLSGKIEIRTGVGGDGLKGGGAGGVLDNTTISTVGNDLGIIVGNGGNGEVTLTTGKANGGAGGRVNHLDVTAAGNMVPDPLNVTSLIELPVTVTVDSGTGGDGGTLTGNVSRGGVGGVVTKANINSAGSVLLTAGNGGDGGGGAAGAGGSIMGSGIFARGGDAKMAAGDAGVNGLKAAVGGSVKGTSSVALAGVFGTHDVTLTAGDGSHGGAGGSLNFIGYGAASQALVPTPTGNITIRSGDGSAEGNVAGAGGSISNISGSVSSGFQSLTSITAGKGGGSPTKSAAGGSITNLLIQRGPADIVDPHTGVINPAGSLTIEAGDAGNAGAAAGSITAGAGANGGSISNVTVLEIGQGTTFRSLVAGDGATGFTKGGLGGSVKEVHVLGHDIGAKTGQPFGIATMGGIFAGVGGDGTTHGLAGSVTGITADSIAAIAAGKTASPELAERVERITLNAGPVLPPALSTSATAQFQLTYHPVMEYTVPAGGFDSPGNPGAQTFTRLLGGTGSSQQPGGGPTTFTLTYGTGINKVTTAPIDANAPATGPGSIQDALDAAGFPGTSVTGNATSFTIDFTLPNSDGPITGIGIEKTQPLPGNTVPAKLRAALNQLPNIDDKIANNNKFDGVDVITTPTSNYQITFRNQGDAGDITAERLHAGFTTVTTIGDATHAETQNVDLLGVGGFTLRYGNNPSDVTARLPVDATPAQVEAALNALPFITFDGGVTVTQGANGSYDVHFNFPGQTQFVIQATEFSGITTSTIRAGAFDTVELVKGGANLEQQTFTPATSGTYRLTYQGVTTANVLPANATAADVKTALNSLSTIAANGLVDVAGTAQNGFTITFQQGGYDADPITIQQSEQQTVNLPLLRYGNPNGLVFQVVDTSGATPVVSEVTLPGDATAAQVQAQLNSLPVIASHNGVTVKLSPDNTFTISFKTAADATGLAITGFEQLPTTVAEVVPGTNTAPTPITTVQDGDGSAQPEKQAYVPPTVGTYKLTFRSNGSIPLDASNTTAALPANATTADVEAALNALPSMMQANTGVKVVLSNGAYSITFTNQTFPDEPAIEIAEQAQELQRIDVTGLTVNSTDFTAAEVVKGDADTSVKEVQKVSLGELATPFALTFNGQTTALVPVNATADQVQTALNALSTVTAAGGVDVTGTAAQGYTVTFRTAGDEPALTGHNTTAFNLTSAAVAFGSTETVAGGATHEQQTFKPVNTVTPFTLTFNGQTTTPIVENASNTEVAAALNTMKTIADAGGVTVSGDATTGYTVTFGNNADQPALTGHNVTHTLFGTSSAADVKAELDLLLGGVGVTTFTASETVKGDGSTMEVQSIMPPDTVRSFTLTFGTDTTATIAANATNTEVQTALNALTSVQAAGGVTVTGDATTGYGVTFGAMADEPSLVGHTLPTATVQSVTGGPNGIFDVAFATLFDQPSLVASEVMPLNPLTATSGGVIKLQVPHLLSFTAPEFQAAHIVGAIADFNELGADIFRYIDTNHDGKFTLGDGSGDVPVDGLIAAKVFNQNAPTNFTPQARYVLNTVATNGKTLVPSAPGSEFFDFHNVV